MTEIGQNRTFATMRHQLPPCKNPWTSPKPTFTAETIELKLKKALHVVASIALRPTHRGTSQNGLTEEPRLCVPDAASTPSSVLLQEFNFLKNFSGS